MTWGLVAIFAPCLLGSFFVARHYYLDEGLLAASQEGDTAQMKELLNLGADPDKGFDGSLPLCGAVSNGMSDAVKLLLDRGANPNVDCGGLYPLEIAAQDEMNDIVALLKSKGGTRMPQNR